MITLKEGQYLSDVLNEIPTDCILSKRIPGCGATKLELKTDRNSIIIVPNVPVIQSKAKKKPYPMGVYEDISVSDVNNAISLQNTQVPAGDIGVDAPRASCCRLYLAGLVG